MIYEVQGDILLTRAQVIVQGVAVNDPMTRGLARKLHEKCPAMRDEFDAWCEESTPEPGDCWLWGEPGKLQVVNMITLEGADPELNHAGRATRIAIHRALRTLNSLATANRFTSMAIPRLGEDAGGIDWNEVRSMLHSQLGDMLIPIFVYNKHMEGQLASEPGM